MGASLGLDSGELLLALLLGDGQLLTHLVADLLAHGALIAVLALLDEAKLVGLLATALRLRGNHLGLALVGTVKFVLYHLESELVFGCLLLSGELLEALLDGRGGAGVKSSLDLDLEAHGLVDVAGTRGGGLVHGLHLR